MPSAFRSARLPSRIVASSRKSRSCTGWSRRLHAAAKLLAACGLLSTLGGAAGAEEVSAVRKATESIRVADLKEMVHFLASDALEGRAGGSRGGHAAANYLVDRWQKLKLVPAGEGNGWFQSFLGSHRNLLAVWPGSDPKLKNEYIVVCAHYDHVGYGNSANSNGPIGHIHNGADDNASGTSALLEVAEAFSKLPPQRRSILFALWDGEEAGLLGSKHWTGRPTVPLAQLKLAVNVDMLGKLRRSVEVYGARTAPGLRRMASAANLDNRLALDFQWDMKDDSDHHSFYARNIPTLMLHTGLHDDYHRPSDDAEKVNYEGLETLSRMLFALTLDAANRDVLPTFRAASQRESESQRKQVEQPRLPELPPRLGVVWAPKPSAKAAAKPGAPAEPPAAEDPPGLTIQQVIPASAAAAANLKPGDRVLSINGYPVDHSDTALAVLLAAPNQIELEVERPGEKPGDPGKVEKVPATLGGNAMRIGMSWQVDDAEPETARVTRVVYGSPAGRAGLQVADRILSVGGRNFANLEQLTKLLLETPGPLPLEYEREGKTFHVELAVPPPFTQPTQ